MATCKDCIHYELCLPNSGAYGFKLKPCSKFKNKSDVAEIVRCKDCKNRYMPCRCALWYGSVNETEYFVNRGEGFYCAYGQKKDT